MGSISQEEINQLVALQLGKRNVKGNHRLVEDLGAESADVANIVAAVEEKYMVSIKETEIARIFTPTDLFELVRARTQ